MNPRGLLIAYEEDLILPVVSDLDPFLMGSRGLAFEPLPAEQLDLVRWCVENIEGVLQQPSSASWMKRWLEVLKREVRRMQSACNQGCTCTQTRACTQACRQACASMQSGCNQACARMQSACNQHAIRRAPGCTQSSPVEDEVARAQIPCTPARSPAGSPPDPLRIRIC